MENSDKLITIATLPYSDSHIIKGLLETEGIKCFILDQSSAGLAGHDIFNTVRLNIRESDAKKAQIIINDFEQNRKQQKNISEIEEEIWDSPKGGKNQESSEKNTNEKEGSIDGMSTQNILVIILVALIIIFILYYFFK